MQSSGTIRTILLRRNFLSQFVVNSLRRCSRSRGRVFVLAAEWPSTAKVGCCSFVEWLSELSISHKEQVPLYSENADLLWTAKVDGRCGF